MATQVVSHETRVARGVMTGVIVLAVSAFAGPHARCPQFSACPYLNAVSQGVWMGRVNSTENGEPGEQCPMMREFGAERRPVTGQMGFGTGCPYLDHRDISDDEDEGDDDSALDEGAPYDFEEAGDASVARIVLAAAPPDAAMTISAS